MEELRKSLRVFASKRDWDQFHSPKNLVMALSVEVAELVEHFQWLTQEESYNMTGDKLSKIKDEIGDILIYLTILADKFDIDPIIAANEKVEKNKIKYPITLAKGKADKYTEL